nr:nitrile hydratase accessory protein [Microvirga massiliensis]
MDEDGVVFREPWEAQAFALAVALHEKGVFTWSEWASTLGAEIRRASLTGEDTDGSGYYRHWLKALEALVTRHGVTTASDLSERRDAWDRAAHATPHGQPILLENDPLARS